MYGQITQDEYDKKAYELKQKQYEITDQLNKITQADKEHSITLIKLLDICSRAYELFESSRVDQKKQLINFLLSNLRLRNKLLLFELKKPFDVFLNLKNIENNSIWLPRAVKFQTIF